MGVPFNPTAIVKADLSCDAFERLGSGDLTDHGVVDSLLRRYAAAREHVSRMAAFMAQQAGEGDVLEYFFQGNAKGSTAPVRFSIERLFEEEGAVKALDAQYWQEALALTDLKKVMPAKRRYEWNERIASLDVPAFTADNVQATLLGLLSQRKDFFAERVDGVFRSLSREHVTNRPEGFSKRLITFVHHGDGFYNGNADNVDDLRDVLALLQGRQGKAPRGNTRFFLDWVDRQRRTGEWFSLDGGALSVRLFKKGTLHIDIHPDMAWQLNQVLSHLYPQAIPSSYRSPSKTRPRAQKVTPMSVPLPDEVLQVMDNLRRRRIRQRDGLHLVSVAMDLLQRDKFVRSRVIDALVAIGGQAETPDSIVFDYDPSSVIAEIAFTGSLPDQRSHQFYPTPSDLASYAASKLNVTPTDRVLEPSAGTGRLADHLPSAQTVCVEYAPLHCEVLRAKGYPVVHCGDFLEWAVDREAAFDKILMNPPFTGGQAQAHLSAAVACLAPGGTLVAILPSSMATRWRPDASSVTVEFEEERFGAFPGVSIGVVVAVVTKAV